MNVEQIFNKFLLLQILRVQTPDGTRRIEIELQRTLSNLYELIQKTFAFDDFNFVIYKERNYTQELVSSKSKTIAEEKLKHGDMIYMKRGSSIVSV